MTEREARRMRWEGIVQTAVFVGALLVLVAVLYASVVVQHGRQEAAQRLPAATPAVTAARKAAPTPTVPAYPAPARLSTVSAYPAPGHAPTRASYPRPAGPGSYPLPTPTDAVR